MMISPNIITIARIISVPFLFSSLLFLPQKYLIIRIILNITFTLIAITDLLDGYLARKYKISSKFGKCFDNIADKILVMITLLILIKNGSAQIIPTAIIFFREITVSGVREFISTHESRSIPVSKLSKIKTVIQMIAIGGLILTGPEKEKLYWLSNGVLWFSAIIGLITMKSHLKVAFQTN